MNLSEKQFEIFKILKDKVEKEEQRAIELGKQLKIQLDEMVKSGIIDDYNFDTNLMCFTSSKKVNKKYNVEEGDPIAECFWYFLPKEGLEFSDGWNESYFTKGTLLEDMYFGFAMHCICFDSNLAIDDILAIDDVWIDIKVDYQFFTEKIKR